MIPSVYDGGISTSTTDFSGTVHSLLPIQHTGPNLVENGTFDTNSNWSVGNWTIENGVAKIDGQSGILSQLNPPLQSDKLYKWTFEITEYNSGSVKLYSGSGSDQSTYRSSVGVHTEYFVANGTGRYFYSNAFNGSIDNVSIQLVSNGDFQFERSSSATRVGSDGYIKNVEVLSDELVQNGDFEDVGSELVTYSDFSYGSGGWSLVDGKWTFDDAAAGYLNYPSISVTVGQIYKVVVDVSVPSGVANFRFSSGNAQTMLFDYTNFSDGITTFYTKVTGVNGGIQRLFAPTTLSDAFTLNSISIKEVGQNWTFGDGWSITDDGGNLKAIANNSPSGSRLSQFNLGQNINKKHRIYYTVSNLSQGGFNIWFGGISGNNITENGTYYQEITPTQTTQLFFYNIGTTTGQINNISVVEITDDTDIPRLDFSNAAQPSLLLEPERANLIQYSEDFSQWVANGSTSITGTVSGIISPDGGNNAYLLDKNGQAYGRAEVTHALDSTGNYTFSVFAKKTDIDSWIKLRMDSADGAMETKFNLSNGEIGTTGTLPSDSGVEFYSNGWYRFYIVCNITDLSSTEYTRIYVMDTESGEPNTNPASVYIYGAQLEQGSYPTSYIPTNGETNGVTRNADVCNNAGDSTIFNDAEGVFYVEILKPVLNSPDYSLLSLSDGSTQNTVSLGWTSGGDELFARVIANGTVPVSYISGEFQKDTYYKIALKYKSGDSAVWVNGVEVHPDADTFTFSNSLKSIQFNYGDTGSYKFYGNVRSLLYFNEALTDAELEKLTSSTATQVLNNYSTLLSRVGATYESSGLETKLNELL